MAKDGNAMTSGQSDAMQVTLGWDPLKLKYVKAGPCRPIIAFGPQRSGKTTSVAIPTLLDWRGAAVVTSIRKDVLLATMGHRAEIGRIFIYEPTGRMLDGPAVVGWDLLAECVSWDEAFRMAHYLTQAGELSMSDGGFWNGLAKSLLGPLLYAAAANGYGMVDVMRWVNTQEEYEVRALLMAAGDDKAMEVFESVINMEARARSSVYATLMAVLRAYNHTSVLTSSAGGFRIADFFDGGANTLYLCSPPDDQEELAPLFMALLRKIEHECHLRSNRGSLRPHLLMLLDEAGNIAPLSNLATLASTAAGTGIQLVSIFHDVSQVVSIYGEAKARTIINNHSAWLFLSSNRDPLTRGLVADVLDGEDVSGWPTGEPFVLRRIPSDCSVLIYEGDQARLLQLRSVFTDKALRAMAAKSERMRNLAGSGVGPDFRMPLAIPSAH